MRTARTLTTAAALAAAICIAPAYALESSSTTARSEASGASTTDKGIANPSAAITPKMNGANSSDSRTSANDTSSNDATDETQRKPGFWSRLFHRDANKPKPAKSNADSMPANSTSGTGTGADSNPTGASADQSSNTK
jgi:hypothetical protein